MPQNVTVADIAIIGLGEIGGRFLDEILRLSDRGIRVVCAGPGSRHSAENRG